MREGPPGNTNLERQWELCQESNTIAIVVTYGDRVPLVVETLQRIFRGGVTKAILVENGLAASIRIDLEGQVDLLDGTVLFECLDKNLGSAGGYAAGIARSLDLGAKFLWLLDDDNQVESNTFAIARDELNRNRSLRRRTAVSCLRTADPNHLRLAAGDLVGEVYPKNGEFFGFDFFSRLDMLFRNRKSKIIDSSSHPEPVIPMAPYGGLLVSIEDVRRVGLPDIGLVLYCDDHDFTRRLIAGGVQIRLVVAARINDAGQRWDGGASNSNLYDMIRSSSYWRSYYLLRNVRISEWDLAALENKTFRFFINEFIFTAFVFVSSIRLARPRFFLLFLEAQRDGRHGKKGLKYPLP